MNLKSDDIIRLELEYDSGILPPPFSHTYKLRVGFDKNFVNAQFDLHYTDREEISEEEVFDEGFTLDDDYSYVGEVPKIWEQPFKTLYSQSSWSNKKTLDPPGGIKVLAKDIHGKIIRAIPSNQEAWQYLAQEFIQAIYEINKKEAPLRIQYLIIDARRQKTLYQMTMRFSTRSIDLTVNGNPKEMDWETPKELLAYIYLPDYDYGMAMDSEPTKPGTYIDSGDGFWHEFGKGIFNIDEAFDAVSKIKEEFIKLNQH